MSEFAMYAKLTAKPGKRDELVELLLQAAEGLQANGDCELYIVNLSEDDPDAVWVTELWKDAAAHAASLADERAAAMLQRGRALIAGAEPVRLQPVGGKGI